jgi:hypothetical protein
VGPQQGLRFVLDQCNRWTGYGYEQCPADAPSSQLFCSFDAIRRSTCTYRSYSNLPHWATYVPDQPQLGGPFASMDYCSPPIPASSGDCRVDGQQNALALQRAAQRAEGYGPASRCILSSLGMGVAARVRDGRCMVTRCTADKFLELRLQFNSTSGAQKIEWLRCPQAGGAVSTPNTVPFVGEIFCPPYALVCCADAVLALRHVRRRPVPVPERLYWRALRGERGGRADRRRAGQHAGDVRQRRRRPARGAVRRVGRVGGDLLPWLPLSTADAHLPQGGRHRDWRDVRQGRAVSGQLALLPADQVRGKGTVCRDSVNKCDFAEKCDGVSPNCGIDVAFSDCELDGESPGGTVGERRRHCRDDWRRRGRRVFGRGRHGGARVPVSTAHRCRSTTCSRPRPRRLPASTSEIVATLARVSFRRPILIQWARCRRSARRAA